MMMLLLCRYRHCVHAAAMTGSHRWHVIVGASHPTSPNSRYCARARDCATSLRCSRYP
eukprot:COSAG05_NODE_1567_length_4534_cov_4.122886_3_plen_58_part_00